MRTKMTKRAAVLVALSLLTMGAAACGDDDETAAGADVERYCELSAELDASGEDLELGDEPTEDDIRREVGTLVEENQEQLDELREVAPEEIAEEVRAFTQAFEEVAETGSFEPLETDEITAADEALQEFEQENCAGGDGEGAAADVDAFCEAALEIETAPDPDIDFDSATPEEQAAAAKEFFADLVPTAEEAQANAPEEIAGAVEVGVEAIREGAETGQPGAFESEEFKQAQSELFAFYEANCEVTPLDVSAVDYAFEGVPASIAGGRPVLVNFTNEGSELHEAVFIRKNDDTTESFQELLELPQEEAMAKTTFAGASFAAPGEDGPGVLDLEPGDYALICFVPVGAVDEETEVDGPPHFTRGMIAELTVE